VRRPPACEVVSPGSEERSLLEDFIEMRTVAENTIVCVTVIREVVTSYKIVQ
jgi:hypothetical protein